VYETLRLWQMFSGIGIALETEMVLSLFGSCGRIF